MDQFIPFSPLFYGDFMDFFLLKWYTCLESKQRGDPDCDKLRIPQRKEPPVMSSFVELRGVTKIYQMGEITIPAVNGIDFSIEKGEFVVIVGPSGAGKTTVLNILGGMDRATSGEILVDGIDIAKYNHKHLIRYRRDDIGFVFQFYNLIQNLTALENVELALQICKEPLNAAQVLDDVGLADRKKNFPAQLSGGEQQRVSIAGVLAMNP